MKILRFPLSPVDRGHRAGAARIETGSPAGRGSAGFPPAPANAAGPGSLDGSDGDRRLLWALTVLQRPGLERLVARHATARDVLAAFRSTAPFGADDRRA